MSFEIYEESAATGSKVELYTLTVGSLIYRMHTSVETTITSGGDVYYRTQVSRGNIATGQEYLEVVLPGSHEFPLIYRNVVPGKVASLTIQEFHRADPSSVRVCYKGVVQAVAFSRNASSATLSVVPLNRALSKLIPERTYQSMCNNVLFDTKCQLSAGSHSYIGTVLSVSGNIVTIGGLESAKGDGWSTSGYAEFGGLDYRLILEQDGNDLILILPFHADVLGEDLTVYAGCDRSVSTCASKFSNDINFGGCPYVPTKNIFWSGIR